ncbi:hypothetical protein FSARC_8366 [Fusarium sarcochroum]|uniref:RING-type domain-containing protein n=1 Tax=Fusarium sarcochroum TaxID=1208366 RepID=A0A8H4X6D4_9HYPO|nr:hypothetical protein FSARC_8366 [Fusarium sarcochroum]
MAPITDTYWPAFKQAVEDAPVGDSSPELTCGICLETMDICHPNDHAHDHLARILPCGHIFGTACLAKLLGSKQPNYYQCPTCKTKCHNHPKCDHLSMGRLLPSEVSDYPRVPPVLSAGGQIPPNCSQCEAACIFSDLTSFLKIHDTYRPVPDKDQYVAFYLTHDGQTDEQFREDCIAKNIKHNRVSAFEITGGLSAAWDIYRKSLDVKAGMFWYEMDLNKLRFYGGLFEKSTSPQIEKGSLLRRLFHLESRT